MNHAFDELTKGLAQSVTRRSALKQFGLGLAGMALAFFGLANKAEAGRKVRPSTCTSDADCASGQLCCEGVCVTLVPDWCDQTNNDCCCHCVGKGKNKYIATGLPVCHPGYATCVPVCEWANVMAPDYCNS